MYSANSLVLLQMLESTSREVGQLQSYLFEQQSEEGSNPEDGEEANKVSFSVFGLSSLGNAFVRSLTGKIESH